MAAVKRCLLPTIQGRRQFPGGEDGERGKRRDLLIPDFILDVENELEKAPTEERKHC